VKPTLSYTVWFSQRTGSTLLCRALEDTGVAGKPNEWLNLPPKADALAHYQVATPEALQKKLWELGSTPNGVFGLKFSFSEPHVSDLLATLRAFPGGTADLTRGEVWGNAFPNGKHVFMTRRNKVRLAVSWWKAIQSEEWHRQGGAAPTAKDVEDAYNFDAINHLYAESVMREAGMQAFFTEAGIVPMTVVYEDFVARYEGTVRDILDKLDLKLPEGYAFGAPKLEPLADDISEAWVQRFREERQAGWTNRGW